VSARSSAGVLGLSLALVAAAACARIDPDSLAPEPVRERSRPEAGLIERGGVRVDGRDLTRLAELAGLFYDRVSNRRFNSIATFQDPALHEFFQSREAFADYYADLVDRLQRAHFDAIRPTRVRIRSLDVDADDPTRVRMEVRFVGEDGRPLRFWKTDLVRVDQWREIGGRWWIIPEKL